MPRSSPELPASRPPRVVVENVSPEVDAGRFPIKRVVGEEVEVRADIHADAHDEIAALLRYRKLAERAWTELPMEALGNDAWRASFRVSALEPYRYTVEAWVDRFGTWRRDLLKKVRAGVNEGVDLLVGAELVSETAARARGADAEALVA